MPRPLWILLAILFSSAPCHAAGPSIPVVLGPNAHRLERRAAEELAGQLRQLFDADVTVGEKVPIHSERLILLGQPDSNPSLKSFAGTRWPKLGPQGHVVRSVEHEGRSALVIGGGSPIATLWAVYELGHHFGIRYLLYGDAMPTQRPKLDLKGIDIVREPTLPRRTWLATLDRPLGPVAWNPDEQKRFLGQLVKLKFTGVSLVLGPERPASSLVGLRLPVDGDTPGRTAFRGASFHENLHFVGTTTPAEREKRAEALALGLREAARELGLTASDALARGGSAPPDESLLPQLRLNRLHADLQRLRNQTETGLAIPFGMVGDRDLEMHFLARASFDASVTPDSATADLITPLCGEGVAERVRKGFAMIEEASQLIDQNERGFAAPAKDVVLKHALDKETPAWWKKAGELYAGAMDEMYRANTRARDGGRTYLLYHAKRLEFAVHLMDCLGALRLSGVAKGKKEIDQQAAQLEKAVEAMHNALSALSEVSRSGSDRASIALLAEFGYRPLQTALAEAEKAARKR